MYSVIKGEWLFGNGRGRMFYLVLGAGKWYFRVEWVYTVYCIKDSVVFFSWVYLECPWYLAACVWYIGRVFEFY